MGRKPRTTEGERVYNRILAEREARGITRQDFATEIGVHYQTVGYLEREEYSPSLALALRIARTLELPVEAVFSAEPFAEPTSDRPHEHRST